MLLPFSFDYIIKHCFTSTKFAALQAIYTEIISAGTHPFFLGMLDKMCKKFYTEHWNNCTKEVTS